MWPFWPSFTSSWILCYYQPVRRKVYGEDRQTSAKHVDDLHWKVQPRAGVVEAHPQIAASEQSRVIVGFQPQSQHLEFGTMSCPFHICDQLEVVVFLWSLPSDKHIQKWRSRVGLALIPLQRFQKYPKILIFSPAGTTNQHQIVRFPFYSHLP